MRTECHDFVPQDSREPTILIVDDDPGTVDTFRIALRAQGYRILTATSVADALSLTRAQTPDLMIVDLRLEDGLGTELVRALQIAGCGVPFVLISAFLTIQTAVYATRLGALEVLEKPIDIDELTAFVTSEVTKCRAAAALSTNGGRLWGSVADRWARHVVSGTQSESDPKTLALWARRAGVSYTTLCETCRIVDVRPHDARDFCRMLRAVICARIHRCRAESFLDVSDRRTLRMLVERSGGLGLTAELDMGIDDFLRRQRFVEQGNGGLSAVRDLLAKGTVAEK